MERLEYLDDENWRGSFYELSLELDSSGDDSTVLRALQVLWNQPELRGPWVEKSSFGLDPNPVTVSTEGVRLYGCLTLDDGVELGCASYVVRAQGEPDWLDLSIPTGMLSLRYSASYPLDLATTPGLAQLERQLVKISARIFDAVPIRLGLLGEEASGLTSAAELTVADCERGGLLVPPKLWHMLGPSRVPETASPDLLYVPFHGPQITFDQAHARRP